MSPAINFECSGLRAIAPPLVRYNALSFNLRDADSPSTWDERMLAHTETGLDVGAIKTIRTALSGRFITSHKRSYRMPAPSGDSQFRPSAEAIVGQPSRALLLIGAQITVRRHERTEKLEPDSDVSARRTHMLTSIQSGLPISGRKVDTVLADACRAIPLVAIRKNWSETARKRTPGCRGTPICLCIVDFRK